PFWQGPAHGDTTLMAAVDAQGNAAVLVHSLGFSFGSGIVAGSTGIVMNNRAGRGFYLQPGMNQYQGGQEPMSTLMAWMVQDSENRLRFVGGTPGGDGQPQWNLQMLSALLLQHVNVQQAVEAPRWTVGPGTDSDQIDCSPALHMENRWPFEAGDLPFWPYPLIKQGAWAGGGGAQIIGRDPGGLLSGGSDPRVDGCALGW
ncbi:MAG: gamma-glutamyltransferase, partial [Firmicutes bacterium]|nr:gamma-glutamyltransferase [Bacillota bacterium]